MSAWESDHFDSFKQCIDINECEYEGACGRDALCVNLPGAHKCECPVGFDGSPEEECRDVNECLRSPCGRSALCTNVHGSFRCSCPDGMDGDPWTGCHGESRKFFIAISYAFIISRYNLFPAIQTSSLSERVKSH